MSRHVTSLNHRPGALIIGAGVSGLTSALCLLRRGFGVTVVAEYFAPQVTSSVAGALWEWPPAVCGRHHDPVSLARSKAWCATSYSAFIDLAADPATGVRLRPVTSYFKCPIQEDPAAFSKMRELSCKVRDFRHDAALIAENGVNRHLGLRDAYRYLAPMVDTDSYLPWLQNEIRRGGGRFQEQRIEGLLPDRAPELARAFRANVIVHCAGLGAAELTGDDVYPVRGALVRIRNDGRAGPRIAQAHCLAHDGRSGESGFVFILPRGDDGLVLGGFAEPGERDTGVNLDNYEPVRAMYRRCLEFLPALEQLAIDADSVRVGLRPFRRANVRVEVEEGAKLIHNYGHGGSGVTLSWGCALEVAEHAAEMVR